jgi:hypothetical protein
VQKCAVCEIYTQKPMLTQWLHFPRPRTSPILRQLRSGIGNQHTCTHTEHCTCIAGFIPQSITLQVQRNYADITGWISARSHISLV